MDRPPKPSSTHPLSRGHYAVTEHLDDVALVAQQLDTAIDLSQPSRSLGLTEAQVLQRRAEHGLNQVGNSRHSTVRRLSPTSPQLTAKKETPEILKFMSQFLNPLMLLLLIAGALTFMVRLFEIEISPSNPTHCTYHRPTAFRRPRTRTTSSWHRL